MLQVIRSSRTTVFCKMTFRKTSQFSQESVCDGVSFGKAVSPTVLKRTSLPLFSCEQIKYNFFWFISFKHPLGHVLQNKSFQKFRKTYKKTPLPEFLSDKIVQYQACNFIKETSAQMFYCESCEIVLSTFFTELFQ